MLFENLTYKVVQGGYADMRGIERFGYLVINKDTDVTEYTTQYLPDAINTAKGLMDAMERIENEVSVLDEEDEHVPQGVASH